MLDRSRGMAIGDLDMGKGKGKARPEKDQEMAEPRQGCDHVGVDWNGTCDRCG